MMLGIPTPSPTPMAILSLMSRPEEWVLLAVPEGPPLVPSLPVEAVVGDGVIPMDEVEVTEAAVI